MLLNVCTSFAICLAFNQFGLASHRGSRMCGCLDFERKIMGQQFIWLLGIHWFCITSTASGKLHDVVEIELTTYFELFIGISDVTRCLHGAFHILTSMVLILKEIYSGSGHHLGLQNLDTIFIRLSISTILHAEKLYWVLGLYSSCDQSVPTCSEYLGSPCAITKEQSMNLLARNYRKDFLLSCVSHRMLLY